MARTHIFIPDTQSKGGIVDLVGKKVTQWADGATTASVAYNVGHNQILILRHRD